MISASLSTSQAGDDSDALGGQRFRDQAFRILLMISASISSCGLLFIVLFLLNESLPALRQVGVARFFTDPHWYPLSNQFNVRPMLIATLLTSSGAIVLTAPLAVASAWFQAFYLPPRVARVLERLLELMSGIPSVCYGLWGLIVLAPWVARFGGSGQSLLTATLILTLMILPTVSLASLVALRTVPAMWLDGGAALGLTRAGVIWHIALPASLRGIGVGILLGLCRAIGETMAVVMVAGNVPKVPTSLLAPVRTATANIALEMGYATADHRSLLYATALILTVFIAALTTTRFLFKAKSYA